MTMKLLAQTRTISQVIDHNIQRNYKLWAELRATAYPRQPRQRSAVFPEYGAAGRSPTRRVSGNGMPAQGQ
jgi:hypothetical protein